jgi:hypothetical protein
MHIEDRTYRNRAWRDLDDSHRKHPAAMRRDQQARSLNLARKKNAGIQYQRVGDDHLTDQAGDQNNFVLSQAAIRVESLRALTCC